MDTLVVWLSRFRIWQRFVSLIVLVAVAATVLLAAWASYTQRATAIEQTEDFALSVHQMVLAGLTAMMITGKGGERAVAMSSPCCCCCRRPPRERTRSASRSRSSRQ